jgi:hypothetical protein
VVVFRPGPFGSRSGIGTGKLLVAGPTPPASPSFFLVSYFLSFFVLYLKTSSFFTPSQPADGGPDIAKLPNFDGISDQSINDLKQKLKLKMDQMPPEARKVGPFPLSS